MTSVMRRRAFVSGALVLLAAPLAAEAQQGGKVYRIGVLGLAYRNTVKPWLDEFEHALGNLGWAQGRNVVIEYRFADGRQERLADLAAELVRLRVDVILAAGAGLGALAAQHASTAIPIVVLNHPDPVGSGLVASLARPGGNVTGLSAFSPDLVGREVQLLKEAVPRLSRMAVLRNPTNPTQLSELREAEIAVRPLGCSFRLWTRQLLASSTTPSQRSSKRVRARSSFFVTRFSSLSELGSRSTPQRAGYRRWLIRANSWRPVF
jgi:putative tryptophan/tyrosine transport system substrate-binding protein